MLRSPISPQMSSSLSRTISAKPFVKWAGGKAQLIPEVQCILERGLSAEQSFTYVEPFVGGGAILFHVLERFPQIERAVINDINPDLIAAYKTIQRKLEDLIEGLNEIEQEYRDRKNHDSKKEFYLSKRDEFNRSDRDAIAKTVLFIFLNKTCFNGLYRVNSKGSFNVPFGGYVKPRICDRENLLRVRDRLCNVEIEIGDFQQTLAYAGENTLFYLDPPYKPLDATSSFTSYTKENFTDEDQIRVKEFCDRVHQSGGKFILSNSDVKNSDRENHFFDELYRDKDYTIRRVKAKRNINCKGNGRGLISELLITNLRF